MSLNFCEQQGLKFVKFAINLAKGRGEGGNTMIGAHEAHSNIFLAVYLAN